jgi:hypothetical protein
VQKPSVAKASLPAKSKRTAQNSLFQLAAAREVSKPVRLDALAMEPRRKAAPRKPEKQ